MNSYEKYNHHGSDVFVRKDLKGKHREYCLCFSCANLNIENKKKNCPISNALFDNCVKFNVVTPVFECPNFIKKENE